MPNEGYEYVLIDKHGNEVVKGDVVTDRLGHQMYLQGYNDRSVFVSKDEDYPLLHAQAFAPDVFDLRVVEFEAPYRAVGAGELRARLGSQCSPGGGRVGFVIGPDAKGRICHVASCFSMLEAERTARTYNRLYRSRSQEK